ncbi:EI24 domain-containing protein [Noviherbaspirillum sp. 1P10PC]|uniref:EI24 domain-containing protein n=1 Tax=Noviherbaspirillum sp. 1P10PC TaxID=3132292 RepID=UPI00399FA31B
MHLVVKTFGRAVLSQLHLRMLLLTVLPFVLSLLLWGLALWLGLQPMMDWLGAYFADSSWYQAIRSALDWMGLSSLRSFLVPLMAMWLLLPLMILTALLFVGGVAMPAIARHVSTRWYPGLDRRHGGSVIGSLAVSLGSFVVFACLWLLTLPLNAVPPLALLVQPLLWGWLTYRVMAYDALADHASGEERRILMRQHRWPLLAIGIAVGAMGAAPTMLWLGGALFLVLLPLMAGVAIWVYVLVFVFSGLWFQHYLLAALEQLRRDTMQPDTTLPAAT